MLQISQSFWIALTNAGAMLWVTLPAVIFDYSLALFGENKWIVAIRHNGVRFWLIANMAYQFWLMMHAFGISPTQVPGTH
jgi:hypothetical protein